LQESDLNACIATSEAMILGVPEDGAMLWCGRPARRMTSTNHI